MGLSSAYAAHPSAEVGHTTGRLSGIQDKVKGKERDSGETGSNGGQGSKKVEGTTMKEGNINAEQSSDKRNDKSQEEDGAIKARAVQGRSLRRP